MAARAQRIVNRSTLAELLGLSLTTVDEMRRRGCPCRTGGRRVEFDVAAVVKWREERLRAELGGQSDPKKIDLDELRRRRARAETELAELELARTRGEVVEIETVAEVVSAEYQNVRARLLAQPSKLAPKLARLKAPSKIQAELERAVRGVLGELSGGDDLARRSGESARAPRARRRKPPRRAPSRE